MGPVGRKHISRGMWGGALESGGLKDRDVFVGQYPATSSASFFRPFWMVGMNSFFFLSF